MSTSPLKAIVVDDEDFGRSNLKMVLHRFTPDVTVVGEAPSVVKLQELLQVQQPQLVFLDIRLPGTNGIEFLESNTERSYEVVLVTAYSEYGLRALKAGAIDYLVKPLDIAEVQNAVRKVQQRIAHQQDQRVDANRPLRIPHSKGISLVKPETILRIEADNNYVTLYYVDGTSLTIAKTMKDLETTLRGKGFFRIHKSHLINLRHLKRYTFADGGLAILIDQTSLPISKRKLSQFLKHLESYAASIS
ncbi:MAG: LytR/AlgR family response regulator transcription factor [Salibacteraceae bacterium]